MSKKPKTSRKPLPPDKSLSKPIIKVAKKEKPEIDKRSSITPEKLSVFIECLKQALTLKESLLLAGMNDMQYRRLLKRSVNFRAQVEAAEAHLIIKARSNVADAIEKGDGPMTRWYLERKVSEEFRPQLGDDGQPPGLPPGTIIVLPGSKPHPRIVPENAVQND